MCSNLIIIVLLRECSIVLSCLASTVQLTGTVACIIQLYEEFADRFDLWECKLAIVYCAGLYDSALIENLWQNIINKGDCCAFVCSLWVPGLFVMIICVFLLLDIWMAGAILIFLIWEEGVLLSVIRNWLQVSVYSLLFQPPQNC